MERSENAMRFHGIHRNFICIFSWLLKLILWNTSDGESSSSAEGKNYTHCFLRRWNAALCACHESDFLRPLHHFGALFLANLAAVLEEAFAAREPICLVAIGNQAQAPNTSSAKFTLKFHAVGTPENTVAMEPALHELTFISANVSEE